MKFIHFKLYRRFYLLGLYNGFYFLKIKLSKFVLDPVKCCAKYFAAGTQIL